MFCVVGPKVGRVDDSVIGFPVLSLGIVVEIGELVSCCIVDGKVDGICEKALGYIVGINEGMKLGLTDSIRVGATVG
jgi:hypothetical protein